MDSELLRLGHSDDESPPGWLTRFREKYNLEDSVVPRKKKLTEETPSNMRALMRDQDILCKRQIPLLKKMIKRNRVNRLVENFCLRMKRGVVSRNPKMEEGHFKVRENSSLAKWLMETEGCSLSNFVSSLFSLLSIFSILSLLIVYSLTIVFSEIEKNPELFGLLRIVQLTALPVFSLQIFLNFVTKRYDKGRQLVYLSNIGLHYIKTKFIYDCINLGVLVADVLMQANSLEMSILRMVTLFKVREVLSKMEVLENLYITTFLSEQYWGLFIVLLLNFTAAHILSLALNGMGSLNADFNWLTTHNLSNAPWYERYVWGYYWGTTIMLTVGFGDFAATNYQEAMCLIFIEMISCISLAYNINCVGNLISNLRQQSLEKTRNLKTFQLMAKSHNVEKELQSKINNYIEESFLMKNEFNFKEEDQMLECLPLALKREYLKDVNKKVFSHLAFIKDLTLHSHYLIAEQIIRKISHPEEIILNRRQPTKCIILHKGLLGMVIRHTDNKPTRVIQTLSVADSQSSKLLNLAFIKRRRQEYFLRSLTYSVIYYLENDDFQSYLRQNSLDYQHYCLLRDKLDTTINPDQLYACDHCPNEYHNRFQCPKLHFIPNHMLIASHYLRNISISKQHRHWSTRKRQKFCSVPFSCRSEIEDLKLIRLQMVEQEGSDVADSENPGEMAAMNTMIGQRQSIRRLSQSDRSLSAAEHDNKQESDKPEQSLQDFSFPFSKTLLDKMGVNMFANAGEALKDFWNVETDVLYNWKYYFAADNPEHLINRKLKSKRNYRTRT